MRVFVTGGCGFLGSHVCEYFKNKGWDVVAYDNLTKFELARTGYPEAVREYNKNFLESIGVKVVVGSILDKAAMAEAAAKADYIIHTAAQPAMTISWEHPDLDMETNIIGTFNVLSLAAFRGIPVASCATIHTYGNEINDHLEERPTRYMYSGPNGIYGISELYPMMGGNITPLHVSKYAGDAYVRCFIDTYKLQAASFRLSGIYGTRQFGAEDHGWVANFCIKAVTGKEIIIYGNGKQCRDIIYATDVCRAFEQFWITRASGVYNIGGGPRALISLVECIDLIKEITGNDVVVRHEPDRPGDLRYFCCDTFKAKDRLGWGPEIMPREGLCHLLKWIALNRELFQ
jgi:CDP-paratose 2-epimerase